MGDTGNLGNREVMDDKLYKAARDGNLVSFVEEARHNEIESGRSEEYFLSQTIYTKENILHLAIAYGQNEFIEKVLKGGELLPRAVTDQLIKQQNFCGETPLHDAVRKGNIEFFKLLFEYQQEATVLTPVGMALSMQNIIGDTPLHFALIQGKNEIAKLLVKHYPDLAHVGKNDDGDTPLHVAAEKGNIEFFKLLFGYQEGQQEATVMTPVGINAGLNMQNNQGNTPLHIALINGKDDVASLLAKHCPDLTRSRKNNDGNTPLHVAAEVGNIEFFKLLFGYLEGQQEAKVLTPVGINAGLSMQNNQGNTPLHLAAGAGNTECFKLLLEYDLKQAEVTNKDGNTPLHFAILKLRDEIATLLLERRPELVLVTNNIKETPLHLAVEQYRQIIKLQVKKREEIGSTYFGMIKLMIEKESRVALMQDATGATPLHRAASITSTYTLKIITLMLDHCPQSVEVLDNSGKTILHLLKTIPSYEEAKALLGKGLLGLINHQDKQGNTPLHWAAMNLNYNMARALLNSFAERSIINNNGIAAEALIQEQFEVIMEKKQMTMEVCEATERADVTFLRERLHQFGMIFLFPRDSNRRNILHKLLQLNSGMTMLHADFVDFIKQVVESFPELICQVDLNGDTPLHILLQNSPNTMIPSALKSCTYKVLPLSESSLVEDLLEVFCWYFNKAQEEASVKGGRYDPPWLVQNAVGNTPLHEALRVNHGNKVVKKLLKLDLAVTANLTNNLNETPLHLVGGRPEAAEPLDKDDIKTLKEANMDAACTFDKNGLTPLLRAAQNYNLFIILALLSQSPEATYTMADEKYGKTLFHMLINHPSYSTHNLLRVNPELTRLLIYNDYEGNTPLHLAIQGGRFDHAINFLDGMDPEDMNVLLEKKNDAGTTPCDLIRSASEIPNRLDEILKKHRLLLGYRSVYGIVASKVDGYVNTIGVIAALLMTITFTAAFTVPGGAVQDSANERSKGTPILVNDVAFQVFMFFDILTMCLSAMILFCLLWILAADNKRKSVMLMDSSILLLSISFYTTLLTFMAGVYATTIYVKPWIAIYTLVVCALLMIFMQKSFIVRWVGLTGPVMAFYWNIFVQKVSPIYNFIIFIIKRVLSFIIWLLGYINYITLVNKPEERQSLMRSEV